MDFVVIALVATAVVTAFMAGYKIIALSKAKILAVALANEKIENIRNMPYDDLATEHGPIYPPGNIADEETLARSNINYRVVTDIRYVDDPYDGDALGTVPGKPTDIYPYDYKKVTITVYKVGKDESLATLSTNVSGNAAETASNTGILYLCIIDASGQPVANADVKITNTEVDPQVNIEAVTDSTGCIMIPALPPDLHNHYHLEATKDGYSIDMTYPRTAQNPNQLNPDIDILTQQVTSVTLVIDQDSVLRVRTVDVNGAIMPNIALHIEGSKEIYFNPQTFKYSEDHITDTDGFLELSEMEFDDYKVSVISAGLYLSSSTPTLPLHLAPDSIAEIVIRVTDSASAPRIVSVNPGQGVKPDLTSISATGANFDSSAIMKIVNPSTGAEIIGVDVSVHAGQEIIADFDLSPSTTGFWDVVITNPNGEFARQVGGFEIVTK